MGQDELSFEDFFENGGLPLHILGRDGTILRANRAELELLGYTAEEYVGHNIAEFHADRQAIEVPLTRLSRGEKVIRYPARLCAKDGSIRHVDITSSGCFDSGAYGGSLCSTVDVTAAKLAEEPEKAGDHHWRAALDAVPMPIYITDAEGRITYYNEAAVDFSGRRPKLGTDEWCVTWRLFNVDGTPLPHDECPMAIALKENRPIRDAEAIAERPDGSRVHFQPYPTPLHDKFGTLIGAVNLLVDITHLRQAEVDAARLSAIIVSSNDAIIGKTLDGIVTSWNEGAAGIFGYKASEMVGQSITRIIPPELLDEEFQILSKLRRGEGIDHFDTVRLTKDGRRINISLSISPVRDRSGKLIGASKVARDITQRKQAEETQKLLMGELIHRVKNTLATVQSIATQTLRNAKTPGDFVPSFLGRIQALARAHTLLTQSKWQGAELSKLVRSQVFAEAGEDDRIVCSGPEIMLPPQLTLHMALILHELGTNARKHGALMASRGQVSIKWSVYSTSVQVLHLQWTETGGPPIYVESQPKDGFGTRLIMHSLKSVEGSEAQRRIEAGGITWDIKLPLPQPTIMRPAKVSTSLEGSSLRSDSGKPVAHPRVLVVEDEPLVALEIADTLREVGHHVVGPSGIFDEAMRLIATAEIDAALLDANLGGQPVDELAAALTRRNNPFAFVTGYGRESLPAAFAGAPVLAKPFDTPGLLGITRAMLSPAKAALSLRKQGSSGAAARSNKSD